MYAACKDKCRKRMLALEIKHASIAIGMRDVSLLSAQQYCCFPNSITLPAVSMPVASMSAASDLLLILICSWATCAQHHDPSKEDCSLTLRCLHYPPVDNTKIPANYWRAGSHTDFDTLTLLFQVRRTTMPCAVTFAAVSQTHLTPEPCQCLLQRIFQRTRHLQIV